MDGGVVFVYCVADGVVELAEVRSCVEAFVVEYFVVFHVVDAETPVDVTAVW